MQRKKGPAAAAAASFTVHGPQCVAAFAQVAWNCDDTRIVAAVTDHSMRVWDSHSGAQAHILRQHSAQVCARNGPD